MSDTVKLKYDSASNISFHGTIDTKIEREEWDEMSGWEQDAVVDEHLRNLVDMWVVDDE